MIENILYWNQNTSLILSSLTENNIVKIVLPYFADLPIFTIPIFLVGYWIFATLQNNDSIKQKLLLIFYAEIFAWIIATLIQQFVYVARPLSFLQNKWMFILSHIPDNSFPSDHATIGAAFLVALFLFGYRKIFYYLLPFFILMLIARIIGGIHYPLDILWGLAVGILSGYIVYTIRDTVLCRKINQVIIKLMKKIFL